MSAEILIRVRRTGEYLVIEDGLPTQMGSLHVTPTMPPDNLAIEPNKRAWVGVEPHGDLGIKATLYRTRDGKVLKTETFSEGSGTLIFDLWEVVDKMV